MKFLAILATVALLGGLSQPAKAITCSNCSQEAQEALRQIDTLKKWADQLKSMADQITELKDINSVLKHANSLSGMEGSIGGFSRQAGPRSGALPSLMGGKNEWGTANSRIQEDRLYETTNKDEWSSEMERRERVTANAKAMALAAYKDAEDQLSELDDMKAQIESAQDVTEVTAQSAGVALAQQRLLANQSMLQQANLMLAADDRVTAQRGEQRWRRDIDAWEKKTGSAMEGW